MDCHGLLLGLGQCAELVTQIRGEAGKRQVDGARVALQHNFGIGGAAVVTMYRGYQPASKLWWVSWKLPYCVHSFFHYITIKKTFCSSVANLFITLINISFLLNDKTCDFNADNFWIDFIEKIVNRWKGNRDVSEKFSPLMKYGLSFQGWRTKTPRCNFARKFAENSNLIDTKCLQILMACKPWSSVTTV